MDKPSETPRTDALVDTYERGSSEDDFARMIDGFYAIEHELTRLRAEVEGLRQIVKLYRESHNYCIADSPQGLCNKCKRAEAAIDRARNV